MNIFTAKLESPCVLCDERIKEGDRVTRMTRDPAPAPGRTVGYAHYHHTKGAR